MYHSIVTRSIFLDLEAVSEDTVKQLCTGGHVFFNCLGTTRSQAGSAVSNGIKSYV